MWEGALDNGHTSSSRDASQQQSDPSQQQSDHPTTNSNVQSDARSDHTGSSLKRRKYDIKFKGVYACRVSGGNYWQAQISIYGNTHHLGVFSTAEEAGRAYDEQARALGRKLNFPNEDAPPPRAGQRLGRLPPPPQKLGKLAVVAMSPTLATAGDATLGTFWSGPCWVNDLDDEKVAAFWRGALPREAQSPNDSRAWSTQGGGVAIGTPHWSAPVNAAVVVEELDKSASHPSSHPSPWAPPLSDIAVATYPF
ncbi:hypothetical protein T492DRAFT_937702 [Pavlovales sp. CCMP2436]|nr:hypothetical protein T492DRAFT_937702 [Pavlovales sp. CCMP2436]